MQHRLDGAGPGSYGDILEYMEQVIAENCELREGRFVTASEPRERKLARAMLHSILFRMGVDTTYPQQEDDDAPEGEEHDFQWGDDHVQRCVKCTLPHAHWAGGPCPGSEHPLRPGEYV